MAKGRISACSSRRVEPSKAQTKRIGESKRLKATTKDISITLSPCDLLTGIDCNFSGKVTNIRVHTEKDSKSTEEGETINNDNSREKETRQSSSRDHSNKVDFRSEKNDIPSIEAGTSINGFRPTSFYGPRTENLSGSILVRPNVRVSSKKLIVEHKGVKSKKCVGVKRKHDKHYNSTMVKKKPKTATGGKSGKSLSKQDSYCLRKECVPSQVTDHQMDVNGIREIETGAPLEICYSTTNGFNHNNESQSQTEGTSACKQLMQNSEESTTDLSCPNFVSQKTTSASENETPVRSEGGSVSAEESLQSGTGSVLDGLFLKKKGNEYFFTDSFDSSMYVEGHIPCIENGTGNSLESDSSHSKTYQDSLAVKERAALSVNKFSDDLTENLNSSCTFSMSSPGTSGNNFNPKLQKRGSNSNSSSSQSSPEHQTSIKRYFKSIPGSKCKIKPVANGGTFLLTVESSIDHRNRTSPPRKKKVVKKQEQMYLDLGQRDIGHVTCPTCGMVYTRAQPDDEAAHIRHHKSFVSGLRFLGWKNEHVLQVYHDGRVIMVGPEDHALHLKKVDEIRKVVDSELGFVADVPCRRSEAKTLIFIAAKRVVGCAVAVQIDQGFPVLPSPGHPTTPEQQAAAWCCSTTPQTAQCGVSRIWVHNQYRRKKIATRLLDCVRTNFIYGCIIPRQLLAFSDPTPDGKRLAKSYTRTSQFLVFH